MKKLALALALCGAASAFAQTPAATPAPPPPPARGPAFDLALEAALGALDACTARQQKASVSVVDSAGVLKVLLAGEGAHARGVASSTAKAITALNFQSATSKLGEQAKTDKALADKIAANPAFNARGGGLTLVAGGTVIGAIGVGGARGSDVDEACAQAGLTLIQNRLQ
ncbi:MAG: heme-binding protein [Massilia sp.]